MGRLPDFLIIGAMKAGTTSLHDYLGKHPDIFTSKIKEIHYFSDGKYQQYDLEWYKNQFNTDKKLAGTSPQNYTKCHNKYYQNIPERLAQHLPKVKLIYILRDPIERYKSHILENYYGEPPQDVRYNIESGHYIKTGLYHMQLQAYLPYFDLGQIHILTLEDLIADKLGTLNRIFRFLEVDEMTDPALFDFVSNDHREKVLPFSVKTSLAFRGLQKIAPSVVENMATSSFVKERIFKKGRKKYLNEAEVQRLREAYQPDVLKLKELTGLTFDRWNL